MGLSSDPEHQKHVGLLAALCSQLVEQLTEVTALQQCSQAVYSDAATDLQQGSDLLRSLVGLLANGQELMQQLEGPDDVAAGMPALQDVSRRTQHMQWP